MLSSHFILWCPLILLFSIFPSISEYSNELAIHIRWPKYWNFSFSIGPSNENSGLISFRIPLFNLLAVQGTLRSLLQHHILKTSILWHSVFFMVHFSTIIYDHWEDYSLDYTDLCQQRDVCFSTYFRSVVAFLSGGNHLLISCLQSTSTVILEPKKTKSVTASTFPHLVAMM